MTRFRTVALLAAPYLLAAAPANAETPVPGADYFFFPTNPDTFSGVYFGGGDYVAVVGYTSYDAPNDNFLDPEAYNLTFYTGSSVRSDMYIYSASTVNVGGGDPPTQQPGGAITGSVYVNDTSAVNVSGLATVFDIEGYDQSQINVSGGTVGAIYDNGQAISGIGVNDGSTLSITGGNVLAVRADGGMVNVSGGTTGDIDAFNSGTSITVTSGASVGTVVVQDGAVLSATGGTLGGALASQGGFATVSGATSTGDVGAQGGTVSVSSSTVGGLFAGSATGSVLMSSGLVTGDVSADSGSSILVTGGQVLGNVNAQTQSNITLNTVIVEGSATETSATLDLNSGCVIAGDVVAEAGQLNIDGATIGADLSAEYNANVTVASGNIQGNLEIFDTTRVFMVAGAVSGTSNTLSGSQLIMSGGTTGGLNAHDRSILTMTGGQSTGSLSAFQSSSVFFSGSATITGGLATHDNSQVFITGGTITGGLNAYDTSTVTLDGGALFGTVNIYNGAKLIWAGGTLTANGSIPSSIASTRALSAAVGAPSSIYLHDSGTLEVDGINLSATLLDPGNDNGMYSEYQVSGLFADGTSIPGGVDFFIQNQAGTTPAANLDLATLAQRWIAGSGTWGTAANWSPAIVADGAGAIADFSYATGTITLDGNRTVGTLLIDEGRQLDIAEGTGGATLTLNNNGADAIINVSGNHHIFTPIVAQDNTDISISGGSSLTLDGGITLAAGKILSLASTNRGTLSIPNGSTIGGNLVANAGHIDIEGGAITGNLTAQGSANVTLGSGSIQGTLQMQGNATVTVNGGNIQAGMQIHDNAFVTMNGGTTASVENQDSGQLYVEGGAITGNVSAQGGSYVQLDNGNVQGTLQLHDNALAYINGGTTGGMEVHDSSQALINGGEINGDFNAYDNSSTGYYGGAIVGGINLYNSAVFSMQEAPTAQNSLHAHDTSFLYLAGINLHASLLDPNNDGGMYSEYQLSGFLYDGTPIPGGSDFFIQNPSGASAGASYALLGSGQQWNTSSGSWGTAANWTPGIVADGPSQDASFQSGNAPATITLDGNRTLGELDLYGNQPFTITQGSGGTLTFDYQGLGAYISVEGNHQILAPVVLNDDTQIDIYSDSNSQSSSLTLAGGITVAAGNTLQKVDDGKLSIAFIRGGTLDIEQGAVSIIPNDSPPGASIVEALTIEDGVLDVGNNVILVNYGSGPDPIASIAAWIKSGYNGGGWNGPGIISTAAQTPTNGLLYGVGYADGADNVVAGLSSGQIEIKYTLLGDANLDSLVNGSDFNILAANFNQSITGWDQGDFNYDGLVNAADFNALAANFNQGVSGGASAGDIAALDAFAVANGLSLPTSSVPEPASAAMMVMAGLGILSRRRRSSRSSNPKLQKKTFALKCG